MMEYDQMVIVGYTIVASLVVTVGIMWCFFEEGEKLKKE
jgi:hypothetical protein